jgi:hypothetical protein
MCRELPLRQPAPYRPKHYVRKDIIGCIYKNAEEYDEKLLTAEFKELP